MTEKQLAEVKKLQNICEQEELTLKLNWETLRTRGHMKNDFFHYEEDCLVGFLGMYHFGSRLEICGMVHPEYRRKGIFTHLMHEGIAEAEKRGYQSILLNTPASSDAARQFLRQFSCEFLVAEHRMKWKKTDVIPDPAVFLREMEPTDEELNIQLDILCFGFSERDARNYNKRLRNEQSLQGYMIVAEGKAAGKVWIDRKKKEAWIYGFSVLPSCQGKGIGRKALRAILHAHQDEEYDLFLEVEATNAHALTLYESCGFEAYEQQDYYRYIPNSEQGKKG
ncbi:GNAT family N-acetyltransferase [Bacillus massiliglaciei]|uniref:GNAT family N-acetyltransferase n=1 Tax=Bacillus massiliglaciei TaxID=1816693 RepID=UPI000DA6310F|nr:GNAT family N-acetyltransferase [Bacillus massiliglaciei]